MFEKYLYLYPHTLDDDYNHYTENFFPLIYRTVPKLTITNHYVSTAWPYVLEKIKDLINDDKITGSFVITTNKKIIMDEVLKRAEMKNDFIWFRKYTLKNNLQNENNLQCRIEFLVACNKKKAIEIIDNLIAY